MIALYKLFFERKFNFAFGPKINAPMFAWSIYHDGTPSPRIRGHAPHEQKPWGGINVDKVIPTKILTELNAIRSIEGRASCQGTLTENYGELEVPTYFIFRPMNQNKHYIESLVKKLNNQPGIKAGYDEGNEKFFRVGVIGEMSYETDPKGFLKWWNELPKKIRNSL